MVFRFIHTADLHLDSPLRSLALRNAELAELVGDATRQALVRIVDLALEEQVDALVIAGDLYDGEQTSMKTARFLATQMQRLDEAGIGTFIIRGNHDALSNITKELILPPSVTVFGGRAEAMAAGTGAVPVHIHGLSFARPQAPESLLEKYRRPLPDAVNIGIMHTSLAGAPGHDPYAPSRASDLHDWGFDYWALGHIHAGARHEGARHVVMPGMPQGRDINEAGEKSVALVTIGDDRRITLEQRAVGIAQFERLSVDLSPAEDWRGAIAVIERALGALRDRVGADHLVARLTLEGTTGLNFALRRDRDLLLAEIEQRAMGVGRSWIEALKLETRAPEAGLSGPSADPVEELGLLMRGEIAGQHGVREALRALVIEMQGDLPPEARRFAGEDEAAFEDFLDSLIAEGGEEVLARLKPDGADTQGGRG
ncbi:DNA repair exonuclease SbcCD nuclease subunit [Devosia enhydra]|uniref:DNA repair exonuclease SbcCD nuclease subunit n=1 Tax=Devosia enhydra TaxID=665118 RepID=A0A1K2I1A2_9HYPH|nr:DNA repair exonuclease [Devosia enhydra]SFZ85540.1 DNA repair exonuclease SbcCD nuclease subunit [Devosia enhydra]